MSRAYRFLPPAEQNISTLCEFSRSDLHFQLVDQFFGLGLGAARLAHGIGCLAEANSAPASVHSVFKVSNPDFAASKAALSMPFGYLRDLLIWSTLTCSFSTIGGTLAVSSFHSD